MAAPAAQSPPAPAAAPVAAPASRPRIPRSIEEVDHGQILGFAAELSEASCSSCCCLQLLLKLLSAVVCVAQAAMRCWSLQPPHNTMVTLPLSSLYLQDHPGFHDAAYKQRRVDICNLARSHRMCVCGH